MVIASNIMYIISSFKNYLTQNLDFLDIVIKKLMEFINEDSKSNVPEMAINSIITIVQNTKECFSQSVKGQTMLQLFVGDFEKMRQNVSSNPVLEEMLYETCGYMISSLRDPKLCAQYIQQILNHYIEFWKEVNSNMSNLNFFLNEQICQRISFFIKINLRLCESVQ